jgi:hypothetical protein
MAPGIYFDLSNEAYHDDPALSHSGMTNILQSWPDYWARSVHNPDRKQYYATDAMKFGERSGMYLLENDKFYRRYATAKTGGGHKGSFISSVEYNAIRASIQAIREVDIGNQYFTGGYPEVSVFWQDASTGVMLRARMDYLHTFGAIDFKRIAELNNSGIGRAVRNQGLDIQQYLYLEAIKVARHMLRGKNPNVHGEVNSDWLAAFRDEDDLFFRFLFQRSSPPYIWEIRELDQDLLVEGENAVRHAILRYRRCVERYGLEKPPCGPEEVKTIHAFHVPRRDYDYDQN